MKNIAEKATVLGIGIATMANADAKAMEAYGKLDFDINKELTVLKTETAAANTYDTTADFTKSREKLNGNPPELATVLVQYDNLKDTPEELRKYLKENQITAEILKKWYDKLSKDYTASLQNLSDEASRIGGYNQGHAEKFKKDTDAELEPYRKASEKISNQRVSIAVMIDLLEIPTAEDFIGKPSTIDQKSREIVEWEKKYEMEIKIDDSEDYKGDIDVYHNGEIVSSLVGLRNYKGKPTLSLTKDGKMVFSYVKAKNDQNKIIIYIPENGGMTQKTETSGTRQLYKFTKPTVAQN